MTINDTLVPLFWNLGDLLGDINRVLNVFTYAGQDVQDKVNEVMEPCEVLHGKFYTGIVLWEPMGNGNLSFEMYIQKGMQRPFFQVSYHDEGGCSSLGSVVAARPYQGALRLRGDPIQVNGFRNNGHTDILLESMCSRIYVGDECYRPTRKDVRKIKGGLEGMCKEVLEMVEWIEDDKSFILKH